MKKIILFVIISTLFPKLIHSQDWKEEYKKQIIENNTLKIQLDEKQKEVNNLLNEKQALEKDTVEYKKFKPGYDKLLEEKHQLQATNKTLTEINNQLNSEKQGLASGNTQIKSEKQALSDDNSNLRSEKRDLTRIIDNLESKLAESKGLKSNNETLNSKNSALETDNQNLKTENERLTGEKEQLMRKNAEIEGEKQKGITESSQLKTDNQKLTDENDTLKKLLLSTIKSSVNYAINSNQYNPSKTDDLILALNNASGFYKGNEIGTLIGKLNQFKELCAAIADAKRVLDRPYDKGTADMALASLAKSTALNPVHTNDIAEYKKLIQEYCSKSEYCAKHMVTVKKYQVEYPNDAKKEIDATLDNIDEKYTYLIKELKEKRQSLRSKTCNFPTNCN